MAILMQKIASLTHFLLYVYNNVLCINGSKVTALNVFRKPQRVHYPREYVMIIKYEER